ncbi:hypothetical protein K2173_010966 [Erythroxylum novogranatense]|uniref:Pentatricopeptide repeat-containing protein n=1 Tax=Erythroxylum novogranatense TaxID=1862640 RepID=A0AAV8T1I6_9ROSI|nr:hypothetical protein K2173_010966 [Erythroxylum novogranatense]
MGATVRMKRSCLLSEDSDFSIYQIALWLKKFLRARALRSNRQIHAVLVTSGIGLNVFSLGSKLLGVYASCGEMKSAIRVFEKIQYPNAFALNWMILASAFNGDYKDAIGYFCLMQKSMHIYNKFTFSIVLKACIGLLDVKKGKEVHAIVKQLGLDNDVFMADALVDMYSKCGSVCHARKVFDRMVKRDVTSWTSMICGYCIVGKVDQALIFFERMKMDGLEPNDFTWNTMIAGYARRGDSYEAFSFLSRMTGAGLLPNLVTWNTMISGFVESQRAVEAVRVFCNMLASGIRPNIVTLTGLLPAYGTIGSIQRGKEIHGLIYRMGLYSNVFLVSALIDMYSKCGSVKDARNIFDKIRYKNVASWNAMIGCYGKHGMVENSMQLFERMQEEGIWANDTTLITILSACSHNCCLEDGLRIFSLMKERYGIEPKREHYTCVIGMLCRSGRMVEACELMKQMNT